MNIFGVPFTFLPHEATEGTPPPPPKPRTRIEAVPERKPYEIDWPNMVRIDQVYGTRLALDLAGVPPLHLAAHDTIQLAEIAPTVEGKADPTRIAEIELEELGRRNRLQTIAFKTAAEVFDQVRPGWPGSREVLLGQLVRIVDRFLASDRIAIAPRVYAEDALRRRIMLTLNMSRIVQHLFDAIRLPCAPTARSHVNFCVYDSTWEASEAFALDHDPHVAAWAKNDHLGFEVHYLFEGGVHKYRPDFLVRLTNGLQLVLETKGQDTAKDRTKRDFMAEWVAAVNEHGGFIAMPTLEDILATLREQRALLSRRYPIRRLALFGSWARGEAREDNDVDVLVEVDPSIGLRFVDLGDELEQALGRRVDLVSRRAIKPSLWERIEPELIDA